MLSLLVYYIVRRSTSEDHGATPQVEPIRPADEMELDLTALDERAREQAFASLEEWESCSKKFAAKRRDLDAQIEATDARLAKIVEGLAA